MRDTTRALKEGAITRDATRYGRSRRSAKSYYLHWKQRHARAATLGNARNMLNAVNALKNGQIDGFVTAGSYPAPNVIEAAASTGVTVLSLSDDQVAQSKRTRLVIPAGTYAGQDSDIVTTSLPVVAYTTSKMDEETAYSLTKTYWENKERLAGDAAWWAGVSTDMLSNITTEIHPGAIRYYKEIGATLSDAHM